MKDEAAEELARLGLTEYQSKVYSALTSLGPSGVSEINRFSGVPRTKVYETLQELISKGMAEFQPGRPAVYRSVRPNVLIRALTEDYMSTAKRAEKLLEGQYESVHSDAEQDPVWIVRGDSTIRRKLAEIVASARKNIMFLETYPPAFIPSVKSVLKAASNKGMKVRAMCVITEGQSTSDFPEPDLIQYKSLFLSPSSEKGNEKKKSIAHPGNKLREDPYLKPLSLTFSRPYGVALIDELEAFVMMRSPTDGTRSIGFSAKIPGVPAILGVTFDRLYAFGKKFDAKP